VIRFLTGSANAVVKLFGITPRNELVAIRSVDELKLLIESSRHKGSLSEEEFLILARAINFEGKSAADALVPRVSIIALEQQTTLADMTRLALESGRSRFPVYAGDIDNIVGIAHIKDTFPYSPEARRNIRVSRIMTDPLFVPEQRPLQSLLAEMRRDRIHMAIVLDEYGGTAGIITLEDLMEEIVGEIEDEYDPTGGRALTGPAGDVPILSGLLHRREVEEACGFPMPEGDFDTLGGFVLDLLGHIPEQGEHASYAGWELRVVEMDGNRVSQVLLVAPSERRAEEEAR
jgi:CBS domain containing-hemolysin-like protein